MNDLSKVAELATKTIRAIKIKNSDGEIVTINVDQNNVIDLSNLSGSSGPSNPASPVKTESDPNPSPTIDYLPSGTVLYTRNGVLPYGENIALQGVTGNFENIEKGIQFNFSDKSTSYKIGGLILKSTYYPIVSGIVFDNQSKFPLMLTKEQLSANKQVVNYKSSISLTAKTDLGVSATVTATNLYIELTPNSNGTIGVSSRSRMPVDGHGTLDWILNNVVVI